MNPPAVRYLARRCDCSRSFEERIRRGKKMPPEKYRITVLLLLLLWSLRLQAHLLLSSFYQASPSSDLLELQSQLIFCPSIACFASYSTTRVLLLWPATRLHLTHLVVKQ
uniref:Uncharacterized protein n=1 Tax=Populus davidiana TaxID=266767 RepID=A0A6M2ERP5_9ROSI